MIWSAIFACSVAPFASWLVPMAADKTKAFTLVPEWRGLLQARGIRPAHVLRPAGLPDDLFAQPRAKLDALSYHRLIDAIVATLDVPAPAACLGSVPREALQLAVLCSATVAEAFARISAHARLVSPLQIEVHDTVGGLEVTLQADGLDLPAHVVLAEMAGWLGLVRAALRNDTAAPIAMELTAPVTDPSYADFFGRTLRQGPFNRMIFLRETAVQPIAAPDPAVFQALPDALGLRLDALPSSATTVARVNAVLTEALPAGKSDVALVGERLGLSGRSLQRRLKGEATSYKLVLQALRVRLARHYLQHSAFSGPEIAFLLDYDDPNSFIRAFHGWTGTSPEAMRRELAGIG